MSRTNLHNPKDVQAIEVRMCDNTFLLSTNSVITIPKVRPTFVWLSNDVICDDEVDGFSAVCPGTCPVTTCWALTVARLVMFCCETACTTEPVCGSEEYTVTAPVLMVGAVELNTNWNAGWPAVPAGLVWTRCPLEFRTNCCPCWGAKTGLSWFNVCTWAAGSVTTFGCLLSVSSIVKSMILRVAVPAGEVIGAVGVALLAITGTLVVTPTCDDGCVTGAKVDLFKATTLEGYWTWFVTDVDRAGDVFVRDPDVICCLVVSNKLFTVGVWKLAVLTGAAARGSWNIEHSC